MIWIIARKEFVTNLLTYRFGIGLILCLVSVTVGTLAVIQDYGYRRDSYRKAVREYEERLAEETPYSGTMDEIKAFREPRKLAIFSVGADRWQGNIAETGFNKVPVKVQWLESLNPFLAVFRSIDLSLIVQVIIGLLAVLFAYDSVSGEKEEGTLKLILANQVPRDQLLLGKALGDIGVLGLILLAGFSIGLLIVQISPEVELNGEELGRIGALFLVSLFYLTAVYFLGLLVSTSTQLPSTSLVVSMFIWMGAVAIFPSAVAYAVDKLMPMSAFEKAAEEKFVQMKERFSSESRDLEKKHLGDISYRDLFTKGFGGPGPRVHWLDHISHVGNFKLGPEREDMVRMLRYWKVPFAEEEALASLIAKFKTVAREKGRDDILEIYLGRDSPAEIKRKVATIGKFSKELQHLRIDYATRAWSEAWEPVEQRQKKATDLVRIITLLSPAGAYANAAAILARTDREDYWRFLNAARQYRRQLISHFEEEGIFEAREWYNMQENKTALLGLPRFRESSQTVWQSVGHAGPNLMVLAGFNIICFLGAYWRFRRYDVR